MLNIVFTLLWTSICDLDSVAAVLQYSSQSATGVAIDLCAV